MNEYNIHNTMEDLNTLYKSILDQRVGPIENAHTFLDVGEWGLALDAIADYYLQNKLVMLDTQFLLFDKIAIFLDVYGDHGLEAARELRDLHKNE